MNEQFEQWWQVFDATPRQSILGLKTAAWEGWKGHEESTKPEKHFACHIDIGHPDPECVLDTGNYQDCTEARLLKEEGRGKTDCEFWNLVED